MSATNPRVVTHRRTTVALGTFVTIEAAVPHSTDGSLLLDAICDLLERVGARMHPGRADGDLVAIGRAARGAQIRVDPMTCDVLVQSMEISRDSGGAFDPCLPDQPGRLVDLELTPPDRVRVTGEACALDLGGIAKGYAIDRIIALLADAHCPSGLVNAGGDARVFGSFDHPFEVRAQGAAPIVVTLRDEAIAVSAPRGPDSPFEHRGFYSPLTGKQVPGRAIAVCAPTAAVADALTKCALLCTPSDLQRLLAKYRARLIELPPAA